MKRLFLLLCFCMSNYAFSQYFEFQVDTDTPNETFTIPTDNSLTYDYTVEVFTVGNPNVTTYPNVTGDLTVTLPAGSHIFRIVEGSLFPRIHFANSPNSNRLKLVNIYRWGNNPWATMEEAFEGCENLTLSATDTPNLANVTSTRRMFFGATTLQESTTNTRIGLWHMSTIKDMAQMFRDCTVFNEDISNWDTSSAETFLRMFQGAAAFDQNLGNWDISNITSTDAIFAQAGVSTSNYDSIIIGWGTLDPGETAIPTSINMRFDNSTYCTAVGLRNTLSNAPFNWAFTDSGLNCATISEETLFITTWETTMANETITIPTAGGNQEYYIDWGDGTIENQVTGSSTHTYTSAGIHIIKIGGQFPGIRFGGSGDRLKIQSVNQWGTIPWLSLFEAFEGCSNLTYTATDAPDLSRITQVDRMFGGCTRFNASNLNNWDMSTIKSVTFMFNGASDFNGDITGWDVSNITDFRNMLTDNINFNQNISGWTINNSEPVDMGGMFAGAIKFNQPIGSWNVSQVTDMRFMLERALNFNQPLATWDVSNVTNMRGMFFEAFDFNQSLGSWDISSMTDAELMLSRVGLSKTNYDTTLTGWATLDTGETQIPMNITIDVLGLAYCEATPDRQNLEDNFNWTFIGDYPVCLSDLAFITTWQTTTNNESITIPTEGSGYNYEVDWGDGTIESNLTGDATHTYALPGTYTVQILGDFPRIFFNSTGDRLKIQSIIQWGPIEWSSFIRAFRGCENLTITATDAPDLSNVTNLFDAFRSCSNIGSPDLNHWDVSNITETSNMFLESNFNGSISDWDVGNVNRFGFMFARTPFNQDISNWNIGEHVDVIFAMSGMFRENSAFSYSLNSWDVSKVRGMRNMFQDATSFNHSLASWDISSATNMSNMLDNSGISDENYNTTLIGWATLETGEAQIPTDITLGAQGLQYCTATADRQRLDDNFNWTFIGDSQNCVACIGGMTTYTTMGWDNGTPDSTTNAVIDADYDTAVEDADIDACSCTINSGATVTVTAGHYLQTVVNLTVDGTLNVAHEGSVVQTNENAITVNNGSISISKTTPTIDDRNFVAMSSPVTAEARDRAYGNSRAVFSIIPSNFVPFVIDFGAFPEFEDAENFLDDNNDYLLPVTGSTALPDAGIGQLVFPQPAPNVGDGAYTITYTQNPSNPGTLNSGTITVPINYNGPATINNYNLLGNPYASAIDVTEFISTNDAVNEVFYWDHLTNPTADLPGFGTSNFSMNDISMRNAMMGVAAVNGGTAPGQFMASGQGFGIKADQAEMMANTPVVFTNSIRVTGNNDGFRNAENNAIDRLWLNLTTEAYEEATSQIGIGFTENATQGYDPGYDSPRLGTFISLFTTLETGEQLSIQGREAFDTQIEITLGFATSVETLESYAISIDHLEGINIENASVYLIDNLTNTTTNLNEDRYSFTATNGIQPERFTIVFQKRDVLNTDEFSFRESVTLYPNPATDQVTLGYVGQAHLQQLTITDMNGKTVRIMSLENFQSSQVIDTSRLSKGMYFLHIQSTKDTVVRKLMIK